MAEIPEIPDSERSTESLIEELELLERWIIERQLKRWGFHD